MRKIMDSEMVNGTPNEYTAMSDEEVLEAAEKIMDKFDEAFKELAK